VTFETNGSPSNSKNNFTCAMVCVQWCVCVYACLCVCVCVRERERESICCDPLLVYPLETQFHLRGGVCIRVCMYVCVCVCERERFVTNGSPTQWRKNHLCMVYLYVCVYVCVCVFVCVGSANSLPTDWNNNFTCAWCVCMCLCVHVCMCGGVVTKT